MWTAVVAIVGLVTLILKWWFAPKQIKSRLEDQLQDVRKQIEKVRYESDEALVRRDGLTVTQCDAELDRLRQDEARILQRLAADFPDVKRS